MLTTRTCTGINVSQGHFPDTFLLGASAVFHTKGKDKDHDTALDIKVFDQEGTLVAERLGVLGHWINKTSYLVTLDLRASPMIAAPPGESEAFAGSVALAIRPNGSECWEFAYDLWLFFSRKATVQSHGSDKILTHETPSLIDEFRSQVTTS